MAFSGITTAGSVVALPQALRDVYSADILHAALGVMRYEEFAVKKEELTATPGQTVQLTKYNNIPRGGALTEGVAMVPNSMSASQVPCTVGEFGNALGVTEKLLRLSWDNMMAEMAYQLGRDYALVRDLFLRDLLVAGGNVIFSDPTALVLADVGAADKFNIESIRVAVERLQTANAPKFYNDFYTCFIHPHQLAYLKRDPDWISANNYHQTRAPFNGEAGRWEDVIFISTTHQGNGAAAPTDAGYDATLDGTGTAGVDLYRATVVADQAYGVCDALYVEMRDDGVRDFGRLHSLAWYAMWGGARIENPFIQHIISS